MERKTCPSCGTLIEADRPGGLCPACLVNVGLQSDSMMPAPRLRCTGCQTTLAEDALFCARCGAPAPVVPALEGDRVRAALEAKLQAQYRIVRLLGRGGMGSVYLARDLALDREVAIKVVKTETHGAEVHDRLRREARTAARLSHPNIVPLHAFGEVDGMPYFVMGYVRGESLATRLRRDGRLPEQEVRRLLADLAEALDHAHRQGVIHRDVKPDNVLLDDESGRALLTDFGVAKALGEGETLTAAGSVIGTPHYMSPEQAAGRPDVDARTDIYSLGVLAYAMLTGRVPFDGKTPADILAKHLTQEPPALRSLVPSLSDSTVQAVERCLAKDSSRRWPDARSLKLVLGVAEEPQVPDTLQAVEGQGLLVAYMLMPLLAAIARVDPSLNGVLYVSGGCALVYAGVTALLMREGLSLGQSQRAIWTEPSWWPLWYPLRRPSNVWNRLPAAVRWVRTLPVPLIALGILGPTDAVLRFVDWHRIPFWLHQGIVAGGAVLLVLWYALLLRVRREIQRRGLDAADAARVALSVPPSRTSFWARPHIEAILAPAPRTEGVPRSDAPHDQLQSILRNADELSGALRPLGSQAAVAARQLLVSVDHVDREIAELTRSLDAGEEQRLVEKIAALGNAGGDAGAPMRQLLEKQLDLVRELSARLQEAREERSRKVELLRTLALHLTSLRARAAEAPGDVPSLSEHVRALCDEIRGQALALAEARGAGAAAEGTSTFVRAPERTDK